MPNMTIKDIARLSGCSVSTISRVINDRPDVRPETKEKVLQMMPVSYTHLTLPTTPYV